MSCSECCSRFRQYEDEEGRGGTDLETGEEVRDELSKRSLVLDSTSNSLFAQIVRQYYS
jgi:hypothetical protein